MDWYNRDKRRIWEFDLSNNEIIFKPESKSRSRGASEHAVYHPAPAVFSDTSKGFEFYLDHDMEWRSSSFASLDEESTRRVDPLSRVGTSSQSTTPQKRAEYIYEIFKQLFNTIETPESKETLVENDSELKSEYKDMAFFFRGQSDKQWGLTSSLSRIIAEKIPESSDPNAFEHLLKETEQNILTTAKSNGIVRNMRDLERLCLLQHHEIYTRLIDVTTDWRIALFFACAENHRVDGRMFLFFSPNSRIIHVNKFPDSLPWDSDDKEAFLLKSPLSDPRMIAQQGHFLCGRSDYTDSLEKYLAKRINQLSIRINLPMLEEVDKPLTLKETLEHFVYVAAKQPFSISGTSMIIKASEKPYFLKLLQEDTDSISRDNVYPPLLESKRLLNFIAKQTTFES